MTTILIVFQVILVILITISVLLQKSSSIGLGAYSGSNESLFGAKGPAGFLAKFTFFLGVLLIVNTVALSYVNNTAGKSSLAEKIASPQAPSEANASNEVVPNSAPQAPQAPSVPQN